MLAKRMCLVLLAALCLAPAALAGGGHYTIDGGSPHQRAQVKLALDASAFNWSLVPWTVNIGIIPNLGTSEAWPGRIALDTNLLDSGDFSWGVIQHEYAHQVDFALFNDSVHTQLLPLLGGACWFCANVVHDQEGGERFASTLAWSYWPNPDSAMKPQGVKDESAALAPAAFRALLRDTLMSLAVGNADLLPLDLPQPPQSHIGTAVQKTIGKKGPQKLATKKAAQKSKARKQTHSRH